MSHTTVLSLVGIAAGPDGLVVDRGAAGRDEQPPRSLDQLSRSQRLHAQAAAIDTDGACGQRIPAAAMLREGRWMDLSPHVPDRTLDSPEKILSTLEDIIDRRSRDQRSLWIMWLDQQSRPLPVISPIDDLPDEPDDLLVRNLFGILGDMLDGHAPGGSVLLTVTRPGPLSIEDFDRRWFFALHAMARSSGVRLLDLHLATRAGTRSLQLDDVA